MLQRSSGNVMLQWDRMMECCSTCSKLCAQCTVMRHTSQPAGASRKAMPRGLCSGAVANAGPLLGTQQITHYNAVMPAAGMPLCMRYNEA